MKYLIKRKITRNITTKRGPAVKYSFLVQAESGNEEWVGAWGGSKADGFQEGDTVDEHVEANQVGDKTYYNFKLESRPKDAGVMEALNEIKAMLKTLMDRNVAEEEIEEELPRLPSDTTGAPF